MRVLIISPKMRGIGGIAQHVATLARKLEERGCTVRVVASENTPIVRIKGLRNPSFAAMACFKCALREFDVVHAHNIPSALPMRLARGKKVLTIHGIYSECVRLTHRSPVARLAKWLEKKALSWADVVTTVSRSATEYYRRMGVEAVYVPNAIDLNIVPDTARRLYPVQVMFAGRLSREKGVDVLIEAFRGIRDAHLVIAGKGPAESALREMAKNCDNVHFVGFISDRRKVLEYMKGSDLFVLPSRVEGLPTVLLEAMACKVPVVATAVGGNVELVEDGVTGLLVKPEDPAALREAIERLLSDRELASRLAENAYRRVVEEYSWDVVIEKYLEVYGDP